MKFPTKIPNRKTKCKSAKTSNSNNLNESLDILRLDPSLSLPDTKIPQYQRAAAGNNGTNFKAHKCPILKYVFNMTPLFLETSGIYYGLLSNPNTSVVAQGRSVWVDADLCGESIVSSSNPKSLHVIFLPEVPSGHSVP